MWVSHVMDRFNVVLMIQLLCCLPESMVHVRAHYICEVGQEKNEDKVWKWVLPDKDPCRCTKVRYGGVNPYTPKRPFKPVYVDKPMVGDNIVEIRDHYDLNCIELTCPINGSVIGNTDPGRATGMVTWGTRAVGNDAKSMDVVCKPDLGFKFPIGRTDITCIADDNNGSNKSCTFEVAVFDKEAPDLSCPADFEATTHTGKAYALEVYQSPKAQDNSGEMCDAVCFPSPESQFLIGKTRVTCETGDSSSNNVTCDFEVDVKDKEPPVLTQCPTDRQNETLPGQAIAIVTYQTPNATDNSNEDMSVVCIPLSTSEFPIGQTRVTCETADSSGNKATCDFEVDVKDKEPPVLTQCPVDRQNETLPGQAIAIVTYQTPNATDNSNEDMSVVCIPLSTSEFPIGQTRVTCETADSSGNKATCDFEVDVKDKEPPVLTQCPVDRQNETLPGQAIAIVTYQTPNATDHSNEDMSVVCIPLSTSEFPIGQTRVTCETADSSGNKATCDFEVDVKDKEPPVLTQCPVDQQNETLPGKAMAIVTYQTPIATDNSNEDESVVCIPPSTSEFPLGRINVTCLARDSSGNSVTCDFEVHVIDKERPVITQCPSYQEIATRPGQATAMITYQLPLATDNSNEIMNVSCTPPSGYQFPLEQTTVSCSTQDSSGNEEICNFSVNVKEEYCSTGWDHIYYSYRFYHVYENYRMYLSNYNITCDGVLTKWSVYPKVTSTLKAIIWRQAVSGGPYAVVSINTIMITADHVDKSMIYSIPEALRINVQVGDIIGWACKDGVLARGYEGGAIVRWKHLHDISDIYLEAQEFFEISGSIGDYYSMPHYSYAINALVEPIAENSICSNGWNGTKYIHTYMHILPESYISCNGVVASWKLYTTGIASLKVIIWRHTSGESYKVVGFNTIDISENQIHGQITYNVPEALRIEVQAGDMIGWASSAYDDVLWCMVFGSGGVLLDSLTYNASIKVNAIYQTSGENARQTCAIRATVKPHEASCPEGWNLFGYHCYVAENALVTFDEAEDACNYIGGHLASIHSQGEDKFIYDFLARIRDYSQGVEDNKYWIGFTDELKEGTFVWTDGSETNYTNWHPREPNNRNNGEDCTMIGHFLEYEPAYTWNDASCENAHPYVCKKNSH